MSSDTAKDQFSEDIAAVQGIKAIPTILDIVCRTTGMRFAAVARVTEDRRIACSVRDEIAFGLTPGGELDVKTTICDEIRESGQAVVIDHVAADPAFCNHHTPATYGLQSYISMPIRLTDGSFFGTLCAIDPEPHRLNTSETIRMFEMFAGVIGFHLSAVDRLAFSEATLLHEQKTAALREQFIAVLGHDLRNPLAAIDSGVHLLLKTPLNDKATRILSMMRNSVGRMSELIDNVADFARARMGGGIALDRSSAAQLDPAFRHVVAELQAAFPERRIETSFSFKEPVHGDRQRLSQLLSNLLANALTHGASARPVYVSASSANGCFELSVANSGDPIPAAMMKDIFQPFTRGAHRPSLQGLGLGLYISHEIARAHGGVLSVESNQDETRFTLRMAA